MSPPGRLPVAPRPLPGEALSSWMSRVAARYGLEAEGLLASLAPRPIGAVRRLDHGPLPPGTVAALSAAAGLAREDIAALRSPVPPGWSRAPWHRGHRQAWCRGCIRDSVARHGEVHWRADWAFGGFVVCTEHRQGLAGSACPACGSGFHPRPMRGRLRLWCDGCKACADARMSGGPEFVHDAWPRGAPVVLMTEAAWALLARFQADLLRAARGRPPEGGWVPDAGPDELLAVVRHLAFLIADWPRSDRADPDWHPGHEPAAGLAATLAVVAAVLQAVGARKARRPPAEPLLFVVSREAGYPFAQLYERLSWADTGPFRRALAGSDHLGLLRALETAVREVDLRQGPLEEQVRAALARRGRDRSTWRPVRRPGIGPPVALRDDRA